MYESNVERQRGFVKKTGTPCSIKQSVRFTEL